MVNIFRHFLVTISMETIPEDMELIPYFSNIKKINYSIY